MKNLVKILLRLEGLAILLVSVYFFSVVSGNWIAFVILFLLPDLALLAYLKDNRFGSTFYNLVHNYMTVLVVVAIGYLIGNDVVISVGLVLSSHIGLDRLVGYGLKYPIGSKTTHLQKV